MFHLPLVSDPEGKGRWGEILKSLFQTAKLIQKIQNNPFIDGVIGQISLIVNDIEKVSLPAPPSVGARSVTTNNPLRLLPPDQVRVRNDNAWHASIFKSFI